MGELIKIEILLRFEILGEKKRKREGNRVFYFLLFLIHFHFFFHFYLYRSGKLFNSIVRIINGHKALFGLKRLILSRGDAGVFNSFKLSNLVRAATIYSF